MHVGSHSVFLVDPKSKFFWRQSTIFRRFRQFPSFFKKLNKNNQNRNDLGKENFISKVWEWKNKSGNEIISQMRQLGVSADWSREKFTMDDELSKTVRKVFIDLFEKKMIFFPKKE